MPAGAVEDHDCVLVRRQGLGELGEEQVHGDGRHGRQHQGEVVAGSRLDSGEDVGPFEALVTQSRGPLALQPPAMAQSTLLADAGFVLEVQADPFVGMAGGGGLQGRGEPLF